MLAIVDRKLAIKGRNMEEKGDSFLDFISGNFF